MQVWSLVTKISTTASSKCIISGEQLIPRLCILEGIMEMFTFYRNRKWQQVQSCINWITHAASSTSVHELSEEVEESNINSDLFSEDEDDVFVPELSSTTYDSDDSEHAEEGHVFPRGSNDVLSTLLQSLCKDSCSLQRSA